MPKRLDGTPDQRVPGRYDVELLDAPPPEHPRAAGAVRGRAPDGRRVADDRYPHGTRARYVFAGCRCESCSQANRLYARELGRRHRDPQRLSPTVSAAEVRRHLAYLQSRGLGSRRVSELSGVRRPIIQAVRSGRQGRLRTENALAILVVRDDPARGTIVSAAPVRAALDRMISAGWTKAFLATEIAGEPRRALQIAQGGSVLVGTAKSVFKLEARLQGQQSPKARRVRRGEQ